MPPFKYNREPSTLTEIFPEGENAEAAYDQVSLEFVPRRGQVEGELIVGQSLIIKPGCEFLAFEYDPETGSIDPSKMTLHAKKGTYRVDHVGMVGFTYRKPGSNALVVGPVENMLVISKARGNKRTHYAFRTVVSL